MYCSTLGGDSKEREASYALEFGCELAAVIGSSENRGKRVSQTRQLRARGRRRRRRRRRRAAMTAAPVG
jgi:hypothetical protein